jgi:hypothetical protein
MLTARPGALASNGEQRWRRSVLGAEDCPNGHDQGCTLSRVQCHCPAARWGAGHHIAVCWVLGCRAEMYPPGHDVRPSSGSGSGTTSRRDRALRIEASSCPYRPAAYLMVNASLPS